ncbi:MAG: hypothetical protein KGL39_46140 [Patescibacteria group bacterium]|nr:hypothetical protein [Patescibacteria group bacterium]
MIPVSCNCGFKSQVKDERAGRDVKCPVCGKAISVPLESLQIDVATDEPLVDRSGAANAVAIRAASSGRRPFYKDPIIVVGSAIPLTILIMFGVYLESRQSLSRLRENIVSLKTEGDALLAKGDDESAFNKYSDIVALAGSRDLEDEAAAARVEDARKARDQLGPKVKAKRDRQEAEARRLAKEKHELAERAARLAQEAAREREEEATLARNSVTLSGGAWVEKKSGSSDVIRGLEVYLVPAKMPRSELTEALLQIKDTATSSLQVAETLAGNPNTNARHRFAAQTTVYGNFLKSVNSLLAADENFRIQTTTLYAMAVVSDMGDEDNLLPGERFSARSRFTEFEKAIGGVRHWKTITNIDGKYSLKDIPGGHYMIYARHLTEYSLIEWLTPAELIKGPEVTVDLFNQNAAIILNKSD